MEIKNAHIDMNARTKSERLALPVVSDCDIGVHIGQFGFAELSIWQKAGTRSQQGDFGLIATLTLHAPKDMETLASGLMAIANAMRVIDSSNAKLRGASHKIKAANPLRPSAPVERRVMPTDNGYEKYYAV
jgi:hypothetical protein